jgi:hypothetical protein
MKKMNKIIHIILICLLCQSNILSQSSNTTQDTSEQDKDESQIDEMDPGDDLLLDSLKDLMGQYSSECLTMTISFNGYESGSDESLYYDSLGVIRGYHVSWDMEGTSGEEFFWFDNGELSYVYKETYGQEDDPDIVFMDSQTDPDKIKNYDPGINGIERRITQLVNDNPDSLIDNDISVAITLEETKDYGIEFIEKTEIYIDKILYDENIKY